MIMNKQKIKAFTLVELIVTITILAILWTIAFISLQWYSTSARDSTRLSDLSSMRSSLELFQLDAGKYPIVTNWVDITYSGWVVWTQWIFWKSVYENVNKLDKTPLDPVTEKEYTYSTTSNRKEYQLWWIMEGDTIAASSPLTRGELRGVLWEGQGVKAANAAETQATAYVIWNYNWVMTKSLSWTTCRVLSIPSIITNDTTITDLQTIVTNNSFVYRWYKNLPSSFKWSKWSRFKYDWWFWFTTNKLEAYSDTWSCTDLTSKTSYTARVNLLKWLQNAYSGTILKNVWEIKNIVSLDINTSSPSGDVIAYAGNFVNNVFGSKIVVDNTSQNNLVISPYDSCLWQNNPTPFSATTTYPWCDTPDIIVCDWTWSWYTISACNVWATVSMTNGWYFQWWNNALMDESTIRDTNRVDASSNWPWNYYNNAVFIYLYSDWSLTSNDNIWWDITNTKEARQWPCSTNYHIPSHNEWVWLYTAWWWGSNSASMSSDLKLSMSSWYFNHSDWNKYHINQQWDYWSTSPSWALIYIFSINATGISPSNIFSRWDAMSVRCFKN